MANAGLAPSISSEEATLFSPQETTGVSFRKWLCGTLLLTIAMCASFVFLNVKTDTLGLYGRRGVRIHILPRFSLYLMTYRFIPENFDGLMIGNSEGSVYDTSQIHGYKVFNAAMRASSMTEERAIAEEVLKRGHLKMVVLILGPTLTSTQTARSAYLTPHDYTASFGSVQMMMIYAQLLREALHRPGPITYDSNGRTHWPLKSTTGVFKPFTTADLTIDPSEGQDLYELLGELHAKEVKVYIVFPPMYEPKWDGQRQQLLQWRSAVMAGLTPDDEVVQIPPALRESIQTGPGNFPDFVHLSNTASATVMDAIAKDIEKKDALRAQTAKLPPASSSNAE
ncbi:hypothetical protein HNQ77_000196 [Silvibacterium bohemicum]|uniref:Uncharacterized protein n=1 Tax=Silvibacterium bohemicum TaxID=1577686 RepID=A0A841JV02_9BACT|nr:hypothetical protein [Silvibacterium bohemicum]MBB6142258.1 hypothetical protein [Silvibacterium bohemicum]